MQILFRYILWKLEKSVFIFNCNSLVWLLIEWMSLNISPAWLLFRKKLTQCIMKSKLESLIKTGVVDKVSCYVNVYYWANNYLILLEFVKDIYFVIILISNKWEDIAEFIKTLCTCISVINKFFLCQETQNNVYVLLLITVY